MTTPFLHLEARWAAPVPITRIEARKLPEGVTVRVTDADGAHGHAIGNERHALLTPILELCARAFLGQDARRLEFLVDEAYVKDSSYKLAGVPLFSCIGLVELAVWDLLAQRAGQPVHALLGPRCAPACRLTSAGLSGRTPRNRRSRPSRRKWPPPEPPPAKSKSAGG